MNFINRFRKYINRILYLILTTILVSNCLGNKPNKNWFNSLKPESNPGPKFFLTSDDKTDYTILLPANPTPQDKKAGEELSKWLEIISGVKFPIMKESENASEKIISIGRTKRLENSGIIEAKENLGNEGYGIVYKDDCLYLFGGKKRGPINAVFSFLEEDLGCRWYTPDCHIIPTIKPLAISVVNRIYIPPLSFRRDPFFRCAFKAEWSLQNKTNAGNVRIKKEWGGSTNAPPGWFVHTFNRLVPWKEYFEKHPEYFSLINGKRQHIDYNTPGQLCLTNNDVLKISKEKVLSVLEKYPDCSFIDVSANDGGRYCECEKCQAIDKPEGSTMATLLLFVNKIADATKEKYPNIYIETLAYKNTFLPPKTIAPKSNVLIRLCTDSHAWSNPFLFITDTEKYQTAAKGWAKMKAKTTIWDYVINFGKYLMPHPNMEVVDKNIQFHLDHGAIGIMLQANYQGIGSSREEMKSWVWAKKLWNPKLSSQDLIKDFTYGYYGNAAQPMQKYNDLLWKARQDFREKQEKSVKHPLTANVVRQAMTLIREAETLALTPEEKRRVRKAKLNILYARLELGPENKEDIQAYLNDLKEFFVIKDEFKVTFHKEGRSRGGTDFSILDKRWKSLSKRPLLSIKPGTFYCDDPDIWMATYLKKHPPKTVEDPEAENGYAVYQPGDNTHWSIHWTLPPDLDYSGKTTYCLRVRMRADKIGDKGPACHVGMYQAKQRKYGISKGIKAADITDKYQWFDIGKVCPDKGAIVYIAPRKNAENIKGIYTDRFELVPAEEKP